MSTDALLQETPAGLYCSAGDFYIDPWKKVARAVITHAHSDHARPGSERYLTTTDGRHVLQSRMGPAAVIDAIDYGTEILINGVRVSLFPAGHVLGSAQVRVEYRGEVWVVSGDYKMTADATCRTFEPVVCHTFITECTFGLPICRWPAQDEVFAEVNRWWRRCRDEQRTAVIMAYSLGKAQRILAGVDRSIGRIFCHSAVEQVNRDYRQSGIPLPETELPGSNSNRTAWEGALVIAPPAAAGSPWLKKFGDVSTAIASGWMLTRGARRWQSVDRGFVLSDHADWPGLLQAIRSSEAGQVLVTHGHTAPMVRWLNEQGISSRSLNTRFRGERLSSDEDPESLPDPDFVLPTDSTDAPDKRPDSGETGQ